MKKLDSVSGEMRINYNGNILIDYDEKKYTLKGLVEFDYKVECEYVYNREESIYFDYNIKNIYINNCHAEKLILSDDNNKELEITDNEEIKKILNNKELMKDLENYVYNEDVIGDYLYDGI